jgi:hypothetical protein
MIALVGIASLVMGCSNSDEIENKNEEESEIKLSASLPTTRTVFSDEGTTMKVEWSCNTYYFNYIKCIIKFNIFCHIQNIIYFRNRNVN